MTRCNEREVYKTVEELMVNAFGDILIMMEPAHPIFPFKIVNPDKTLIGNVVYESPYPTNKLAEIKKDMELNFPKIRQLANIEAAWIGVKISPDLVEEIENIRVAIVFYYDEKINPVFPWEVKNSGKV